MFACACGYHTGLAARAKCMQRAERLALHAQMLYTLSPARKLTIVLAPVGGRGDDVASTLNPVAGRGLTHLVRFGCGLHQVLTMHTGYPPLMDRYWQKRSSFCGQ